VKRGVEYAFEWLTFTDISIVGKYNEIREVDNSKGRSCSGHLGHLRRSMERDTRRWRRMRLSYAVSSVTCIASEQIVYAQGRSAARMISRMYPQA